MHSLEIVGQNYFITQKRREFSNWPFNEIVKGILPWSMLTLHLEDVWYNKTNEALRFITVPEYPQLFSSAQSTRSIWPCCVLIGLGTPLGNYGQVGWWRTTRARCWWDPPLNKESDVIWKASPVRQENRIVEVIPRLLGSSSYPIVNASTLAWLWTRK